MKKGQASSELLLLLGAVLITGLVAIGLLAFYFGTNEEKRATQVSIYWETATPLAVRDAVGASKRGVENYIETTILVLKNLDREKVIIRGITFGDAAGAITYGVYTPESESPDPLRHPIVQGEQCNAIDNANHNCNIPVDPAQTSFVELAPTSNFCTAGSVNSVVKNYQGELKIWYEKRGVVQLETSQIKLNLNCYDYWVCQSVSQCTSKYGATCGAICQDGGCNGGGP